MIIEVLDKYLCRFTTLNDIIDWYGTFEDLNNTNKILIRFRKKSNDMDKIREAKLLRILDKGDIAYVPIAQLFDNYSDEEAEIVGQFKLVKGAYIID